MSIASDVERMMLDLINAERAQYGLDPLQLERNLNSASEIHSEWMIEANVFSHTGAGGSSAGDRMAAAGFDFDGWWSWGENIAWQSERGDPGIADDVADLHEGLMNSPGHRANILNPDFEYIGIGVVEGGYDASGRTWDGVFVTQNFAKTDGSVELDPGTAQADPPPPAPIPPEPTAPDNAAPVLTVDDVTLSKLRGERMERLFRLMDSEDPDGDEIVFYELRDDRGKDNWWLRDVGRIDASDGVLIAADDLGEVRVRHNGKFTSETTVEVRASDGQDWSDWAEITVTTLSPDDWALSLA